MTTLPPIPSVGYAVPGMPKLFIQVNIKEQPIRLVFHGNLTDDELEELLASINRNMPAEVKFAIIEKFYDAGFHYTICTFNHLPDLVLDRKLHALYPLAKRLKLDRQSDLREAVRSIIIT